MVNRRFQRKKLFFLDRWREGVEQIKTNKWNAAIKIQSVLVRGRNARMYFEALVAAAERKREIERLRESGAMSRPMSSAAASSVASRGPPQVLDRSHSWQTDLPTTDNLRYFLTFAYYYYYYYYYR